MSARYLKRVGLGLLISLAILLIADLLPSFVPSPAVRYKLFGLWYLWLAVEGAVFMFVAAAAGAYVARTSFGGPAVLLAIGIWVFIVYFLNSIAAVAGQDDILAIAVSNMLGLLLLVIAAGTGARVGRRFSRQNEHNASTAA